jgi:hypothetical protein
MPIEHKFHRRTVSILSASIADKSVIANLNEFHSICNMLNNRKKLLERIGYQLKVRREQRNLSFKQVHAATGIAVAGIESGQVDLTLDILVVLCEYYQASTYEFLKEVDEIL